MKKIGKLKHRVTALIMSFFLALGLVAPAFTIRAKAEALEVLNASCTVADMIFSYCASGGVAIMNETIIDDVYNVLGGSFGNLQTFVDNGLLTYSNGQYVDTGLSTNINSAISNINSIDIGAMFNQTAQQNPTGVALTGAGSLAGIAGSVASTGVLPVVAGVAVSGYCGFQIGTLIANFLGLYEKPMQMSMPLSTKEEVLSAIPAGSNCVYVRTREGQEWHFYGGGIPFSYISNANDNIIAAGLYNNTSDYLKITYMYTEDNHLNKNTVNVRSHSDKKFAFTEPMTVEAAFRLNSYDDYLNARSQWDRNIFTNEITGAPDVIGSNGNVQGTYENDQYNFPHVVPQIDPQNQSINPSALNKDDWLNYANDSKTNYNNGNSDLNSDLFDDIMDAIRINQPTPSPDTDPEPEPDPDPYPDLNPDPETVPVTVPTVNPYPENYPVADPESVPDNREQPEYTEKPTENETDIVEGDPYTTPNLLNKFPFCIPRDILRAFKKLDSGSREAPHIQWRFHPNGMIDYTFDIDFAVWESIASLLRLLELIAFVVALGVATRNLILS